MFTSRPPPAWMIRSGVRPASRAAIFGRGQGEPPRARPGQVRPARSTRSRSLPLTWIGHLAGRLGRGGRVDLRPALGVDRRHGSPAAARRRDQSSSVMCGAAGASISSSSRIASSQAGAAGDRRAAVAEQRVRQLHELGDHRVEAEALVVLGHVAQRSMRGGRGSRVAARPRPRRPAACPRRDRRARGRADRGRPSRPGSGSGGRRRCPVGLHGPALVPRAHEHQEQADRVRAVALRPARRDPGRCRATCSCARRRRPGSGPG